MADDEDMNDDGFGMFTFQNKSDCTITTGFMGSVRYETYHLLAQYYSPEHHDVTGTFLSRRIDAYTNEVTECVVMACAQLNPALLDCHQSSSLSTNNEDKVSWSPTRFKENEIIFRTTIGRNENAGIIYQSSEIQDHNLFFPGGYLHVFATAKPDGAPLSWVLPKLTSDDLVAVLEGLLKLAKNTRTQQILRSINLVWYDRESKQVWIPPHSILLRAGLDGLSQGLEHPQAMKHLEKFWTNLVALHCREHQLLEVSCPLISLLKYQEGESNESTLCFRNRDNSTTTVTQPENEWTMV